MLRQESQRGKEPAEVRTRQGGGFRSAWSRRHLRAVSAAENPKHGAISQTMPLRLSSSVAGSRLRTQERL